MTGVRLLELRLSRFGAFTDEKLDFGGDAQLFIVFGPNEAGKSTALRAITALLFGVPLHTQDAYRHAMPELRIGGTLKGARGDELSFVRRKGRSNTLLAADGVTPLAESTLKALLGGVTEQVFLASHGLTHVSLRAGGEALLGGQGAARETLFDAARGGRSVGLVLEELKREAETLFRGRRGARCKIRQAVQAFETARKRRDEAALKPALYARQKADLEAARGESARLVKLRRDLRVEQKRLESIERAKPFVLERVELGLEHEELLQSPVVSPGSRSRREQAEGRLRDAARECERTQSELARLERRVSALPPKRSLSSVPPQVIDDIRQRLGSHQKAQEDLPKRQAEQRTLEETARRVELSLGRKEAGKSGDWLIDKQTKAKVQKLARDQLKVEQTLKEARRRHAEHVARLGSARTELQSLGEPSAGTELVDLVESWERKRPLERLAELVDERRGLAALTEQKGLTLGLDAGQQRALARQALPEVEAVEAAYDELEALARKEASLGHDLAEARSRAESVERDLGLLLGDGDTPTEARLSEARQLRELAFQALRDGFERRTAVNLSELEVAYRRRVTDADELSDRLRRESKRVHRHAELVREQKAQASRLEALALLEENLNRERGCLARAWQALWAGSGVVPKSPSVMRGVVRRLLDLQSHAAELLRLQEEEKARRAEVERLRASFELALTRSGVAAANLGVDELVLLSKRHLVRANDTTRRRAELERITLESSAAEAAAEAEARQGETDQAAWTRDFADALGTMGLEPGTSPDGALAVVDGAGELVKIRERISDLKRRVSGMQRDAHAFSEDVRNLARIHLPVELDRPVAEAAYELTQRYDEARRVDAEREHLERERDERLHELARAEEAATSAGAELERLMLEAGVGSTEELRQAEERGTRILAIDDRLREIEQQLFEFRGEGTLSALTEEVQQQDLSRVRLRLAEIDDEFPLVESEHQAAAHRVGSVEAGLLQLDTDSGAAEAAAEMEARLAELRSLTARYAELRLAIRLIESELERYREQSQGPVLKRAGELFSRLTRGTYRALRVDYDAKDVAVLGCVTESSERVEVMSLSDGARDQLYLALRLASLEVQAKQATTLPFILDDVFVHFDDERTQVALSVLGELSADVQIIVFTHHAQVVELARRALPSDRLAVCALKGPS